MSGSVQLILFDLDGTLLDTAPDLGAALNAQRSHHGMPPLAQSLIRPVVSHGSPALLNLGFGITPGDARYPGLRRQLLDIYAARLTDETHCFPGIAAVLDRLEREGRRWGVVTNKPGFLTTPLLAAFGLERRAACVVSGDTTARRKPHPDQLLHACELCKAKTAETVYVGDAQRDIQAARAAGMHALVALYGYIGAEENPHDWDADGLLAQPADLLTWLQQYALPASQ
ncbi:MAG: phosphoglycolate phosphatase [Gammaproteobacteria bacterium]|nr:phosphoglycolate phosphatase [Gammaproteobacteria bacterium]